MTQTSTDPRRSKPTKADKEAAARLKTIWASTKRAREAAGQKLTQDQVGEILDINQSAVSQYINGHIPLNYRALQAFAHILEIDPNEIRSDLPEQQIHLRVGEPLAEYLWDDVLGFAQAAGLGTGAEADEYAETHKLKFRVDSLRRKGLRPQHLVVYYGRGDSMEPRIKDGDAILFDTSDTRPVDDAIFIVQLGKEIYAKRCEILDEAVYFRSDNPHGDHNWRKPRRMGNPREPIQILGRVRWIGSWEQ